MIAIKGYKEVDYQKFQGILFDAYKRSHKTYFQLAGEIGVNSTQTAANALTSSKQKVADEKLTSIMDCVGMSGFILTISGKKHYYIKNK